MPSQGYAQFIRPNEILHSSSEKAIRQYDKAIYELKERNFGKAYKFFHKAIKKDTNFPEPYLQIAKMLELVNTGPGIEGVPSDESPLPYYRKYVEILGISRRTKVVHVKLGDLYLDRGEYENAKEVLIKVKQNATPTEIDAIERKIKICEFAEEAMANPLELRGFQPMPSTINSFDEQYFPSVTTDDKLLAFTTRSYVKQEKPPSKNKKTGFLDWFRKTDEEQKEIIYAIEDEDIYVSKKVDGQWTQAEPIDENINSDENEGTCSISGDGQSMVFTKCVAMGSYRNCDLYISFKSGDRWSRPRNIGKEINTKYWESQPSLSADGQILYYVSDRPDGFGGKDIWMSKKGPNNKWNRPVNLGKVINTPGDEVSPFIHANSSTLYFSSTGHIGMGRHDLFVTEKIGKNLWLDPKNLGYPINTHRDEVAIVVNAPGTKAYYTNDSIVERRHYSRIYEFEMPEKIRPKFKSYFITGMVYDSLTREKLASEIVLKNADKDSTIMFVSSDSISGRYLISLPEGGNYSFYVEKPGYLFVSRHFDLQDSAGTNYHINFPLVPIQQGMTTRLDNIFFDFDKFDLLQESYPELNKVASLLHNNPEISIEIRGHTDDKGSDTYNLELSKNRAASVKEYLISQGIQANRIRSKGFGEQQPLKPNTSPQNRQFNRRIEFVVL